MGAQPFEGLGHIFFSSVFGGPRLHKQVAQL